MKRSSTLYFVYIVFNEPCAYLYTHTLTHVKKGVGTRRKGHSPCSHQHHSNLLGLNSTKSWTTSLWDVSLNSCTHTTDFLSEKMWRIKCLTVNKMDDSWIRGYTFLHVFYSFGDSNINIRYDSNNLTLILGHDYFLCEMYSNSDKCNQTAVEDFKN